MNIPLKNVGWGICLVKCAHADKKYMKISFEYTAIKPCLRTNQCLAEFYADKNHTKISREYIAIKRWLRGLPSRFAYKVTHTKISGAHTIKKRW